MRILIVTQVVDLNHPVLGFFHRWIEEFAKRCEKVTVICLQKGQFKLLSNVQVYSLGKENRQSRLKYLWQFYKFVLQEKKNYDTVFIHMNQEYILLAGWLWRIWGKNILFWRNHAKGNWLTRVAVFFAHKIFYTSPQSFTARFAKAQSMPVGIDTELFKPDPQVERRPHSILALGRISPVKRLDIFVEALIKLHQEGERFHATIVGSPATDHDRGYEQKLHRLAAPLVDAGVLVFKPAVPHNQTPRIYQSHEIYVNLTPLGSFDKTIVEAMSVGVVTIFSNRIAGQGLSTPSVRNLFLEEIDAAYLADKIRRVFGLDSKEEQKIRGEMMSYAKGNSIDALFSRMILWPKNQ